jgi:ubiquinone/menaquinone biosynthesis C-methylase UbiE
MNGDIKKNVTRRSIWLRLCFMIILSVALSAASFIASAVIAFQFLSSLFTGRTNDQLTRLGRNLATYFQQITLYLTFATEEIPFPFMPWPDEPHEQTPADEDGDPPDDIPETAEETAEDDEADDAEIVEALAEEDIGEPDDKPETAGDVADDGKVSDEEKAADAPRTAIFSDSGAYQKFMGERSKLGGERFVKLLDLPPRLSWLDVGCGTGPFSAVIMNNCEPAALIGIDSSEPQITHAQSELGNAQASFRVGDATALPFDVDSFDVAVSSYVLNFVPNKQKMMDEMARVVRPEGTVAISVFDVAGGRQATYPIWELIGRNDLAFREAEFEKRGWDITHPEALTAYFENAGLEDVSVDSIEIDQTFADFDEYWNSMTIMPTSGTSTYLNRLDQSGRQKFQDDLKALMPIEIDGSIKLTSGSWVVRGKVPA